MKVIIRDTDGSVSKVYEMPGIPGKSAYQYAQDGGFTGTEAEFVEKLSQVPLIGDTTKVLPSVVHSSMLSGIPVGLTHTDPTYGTMAFSGFSYSQAASNSIVASVNFEMGGIAFCAQLIGDITSNKWTFKTTNLALSSDIPTKVSQLDNDSGFLTQAPVTSVNNQTGAVKIDIPTALPNPKTLTINGETYDGSSAVDITE